MAAKKASTNSNTVTGKGTDGSLDEVSPAKKTAKKRKRRSTKNPGKVDRLAALPLHEDADPKDLADLAIKIIRLRRANCPAEEMQRALLNNSEVHDALDDAKRLLLAAKGVIDEDVDAYRLFSEKDGLMSYDEIAKRFKRCEWGLVTSRNKVEKIILELLVHAEQEVQKERGRYEALVSVKLSYPGGVYSLADRMRESIREVIGDLELEVLFSNPDQIADVMGQVFYHLMGNDITGDWERHLEEEFFNAVGFDSFISYVCGGMTYEQFNPDGVDARIDADRLACLNFFLQDIEAWAASDFKARAADLNLLMRMVRGPGKLPASIVRQLETLLKELRKPQANEKSVKLVGRAAHDELEKYCQRTYLVRVVQVQEWSQLMSVLGALSEVENGDQLPLKKIQNLHNRLKNIEESVRNLDFVPMEIRADLNALREELEQTSISLRETEFQFIGEKMDKIVESLKRALQSGPFAEQDAANESKLETTLHDLLRDLKPPKGVRKCRPYELFLFAAQKGLLRDDLVRKRSSLVSGVITGPRHLNSPSIIISHSGANLAMGLGETE